MKRSYQQRTNLRSWEAFISMLYRFAKRRFISSEEIFKKSKIYDRRIARWDVYMAHGICATAYIVRRDFADGIYPPMSKIDGPTFGEPYATGEACFFRHAIKCGICGKMIGGKVHRRIDAVFNPVFDDDNYEESYLTGYEYHCKSRICKDLYGWITGKNKSCSKVLLNYREIPPSAERKAHLSAMYLDRRINRFIKVKKNPPRTLSISIDVDSGMVSTDWIRRNFGA